MKSSILRWLRLNGIGIERVSPLREMVKILTEAGVPLRFIQVGANDGLSFDVFMEIAKEFNMTGICIEPVPRFYEILSLVYRHTPGIRTLNAAIHPYHKTMTIFSVRPSAVVSSYQHGLASFDRDHLKRFGARDEDILEEIVPCLTLSDVYNQFFEGQRVDVIQTDTEGFDAEIVKMIDFPKLRPRIVRYEHKHLHAQDRRELDRLFRDNGYRTKLERYDTLAYDTKEFRLSRLLNF